MLDDFIIPSTPTENKVMNNDYLDQVIKTVRGLNFDSDKVVIEEINLSSIALYPSETIVFPFA